MKWNILASRTILSDRWIHLRADRCQMPDGQIVDPFYVLEYPDWLNAVALTAEGEVILTRQYRHGVGSVILELPSGTVEDEDASPEAAMRRELLEETGYVFSELYATSIVSSNPDKCTNLVHSFLAVGGQRIQDPKPGAGEQIELELVSIPEFRRLLRENAFLQSMHVASAYYALEHLDRFGS
jgi:8-oxo-dGTP pyrophosphatase MutT (NUDIX family)